MPQEAGHNQVQLEAEVTDVTLDIVHISGAGHRLHGV